MTETLTESTEIPAGCDPTECKKCGYPVWWVQLSLDAAETLGCINPRTGKLTGWTLLERRRVPGRGGIVMTEDGADMVPHGRGDLRTHYCPERIRRCQNCGQNVVLLSGEDCKLYVAKPDPDEYGEIVLTADGLAVIDTSLTVEGVSYCTHNCPVERDDRRSRRRASR